MLPDVLGFRVFPRSGDDQKDSAPRPGRTRACRRTDHSRGGRMVSEGRRRPERQARTHRPVAYAGSKNSKKVSPSSLRSDQLVVAPNTQGATSSNTHPLPAQFLRPLSDPTSSLRARSGVCTPCARQVLRGNSHCSDVVQASELARDGLSRVDSETRGLSRPVTGRGGSRGHSESPIYRPPTFTTPPGNTSTLPVLRARTRAAVCRRRLIGWRRPPTACLPRR